MANKTEKLKQYYVYWVVRCNGQMIRFETRQSAVNFMCSVRASGLDAEWMFGREGNK